jgi:hypothetical protein
LFLPVLFCTLFGGDALLHPLPFLTRGLFLLAELLQVLFSPQPAPRLNFRVDWRTRLCTAAQAAISAATAATTASSIPSALIAAIC